MERRDARFAKDNCTGDSRAGSHFSLGQRLQQQSEVS
jgi:hypothetical protein